MRKVSTKKEKEGRKKTQLHFQRSFEEEGSQRSPLGSCGRLNGKERGMETFARQTFEEEERGEQLFCF